MDERKENYIKISGQVGISYLFKILVILSQPVLIILMTRILTVEDYGIYSLLFATISMISVFFRFGISEFIKNKLPGLLEEDRIQKLVNIIFFCSIFFLLSGGILYLLEKKIVDFLMISDHSILWPISIAIIILIALYEIIDSYLLSVKKIVLESILSFSIKCSWILAILAIALVSGDFLLEQVFAIWLLMVLVSLMGGLFSVRREINYFIKKSLEIRFSKLIPVLKFSLPLIMVVSFSWIIDVADRYIINFYLSKTELGIYSLAYGIVSTIATIPVIFQNVIRPYFAEKWNLKEDSSIYFNVMLKYTLIICLPIMTGIFLLRDQIITMMSGEKYLTASILVAVLLPLSLLSAIIYIYDQIMLLQNLIWQIILIYFIAAAANIFLNLLLIQRLGIIAAAYSTIISYLMVFLIMLYFHPKEIKINWDYLKIFEMIVASTLMGLGILLANPENSVETILVTLGGMFIYGALLFLLNIFNLEEKELIALTRKKVISFISIGK